MKSTRKTQRQRELTLEEGGATAVAPLSTFDRVRANCTGAPGIDLDKHAAAITEVVALAELRSIRLSRRDEVPAPERP